MTDDGPPGAPRRATPEPLTSSLAGKTCTSVGSPPSDLDRHVRLDGAQGLLEATGRWLALSDWLAVESSECRAYAAATGRAASHWITDDHTLSLCGAMVPRICTVSDRTHALNYGLDDVVYYNRLATGDRFRIALRLHATRDHKSCNGAHRYVDAHWYVLAEAAYQTRPVLSAVMLTRYVF